MKMTSRTLKYILLASIVLLLSLPCTVDAFGLVNINIRVTDENGVPLDNTKLRVRFSGGEMPAIKTTDNQGSCSITSTSSDGVVVGTAIKEGYYETTFHHDFNRKTFGVWQPWGKEFKVVMRPIVNPVPMYVRNTDYYFPAIDKEVGFDLVKADWVIPYGKGTHADFIFKIERKHDDDFKNVYASMMLTFQNPYDGIQVVKDYGGGDFNAGSELRLPRTAPDSGYKPNIQKYYSSGSYGWHDGNPIDNSYIFRVRSEVDEIGKLKSAMYGKIRGDFEYDPFFMGNVKGNNNLGKITMHYYLNPDYTRNLEFDTKRNLFVITDPGENVRAP